MPDPAHGNSICPACLGEGYTTAGGSPLPASFRALPLDGPARYRAWLDLSKCECRKCGCTGLYPNPPRTPARPEPEGFRRPRPEATQDSQPRVEGWNSKA